MRNARPVLDEHLEPARQRAARCGDLLQGMAAGGRPAHADEQSRSRGGGAARRSDRVRRVWQGRPVLARIRRDRRHAAAPGSRRDSRRPVRQAGGGLPHASVGPARIDCEQSAGAGVGHLERFPRPRRQGPHHVRPDDGRQLGRARSFALEANAADVLPELARRGIIPDVVTDQTSAHDALNGYVPNGLSLAEATALRRANPGEYERRSVAAMGAHVRAMLDLQARGAVTFDYGNNIRAQAEKAGVADAFRIPGFVPEYIRPLFCRGKGPFRWAALSGDPADIAATDRLALEMFADDAPLCRWIRLASERVAFQGLPARIFWLGYGERARFGLAINDLVRRGAGRAPIVIGRDHPHTRAGA